VAYRYNDPLDLHWTVLSAAKSARLATIDSPASFAALIKRYPRVLRGRRGLDFEKRASECDGLHLTNEGYLRTRSRRPGPALIGWDCESTLWFRWVFTKGREVKPHFKDADRFYDLRLTLSGWTTEDYSCRLMPGEKASQKSLRSNALGHGCSPSNRQVTCGFTCLILRTGELVGSAPGP
jgi:hypothetical protein